MRESMIDEGGEHDFGGNQQRTNLLDVVLEKLKNSGKTTIFSRVVYVARLNRREQKVDELQEFYRRVLERNDQASEVSGLLVVYPTCMMHMLEARTSTLMAILEDLNSSAAKDSAIAEARILSSTEDIPTRCFSQWHCTFVNSASPADKAEACDPSSLIKTASDVTGFMRRVGLAMEGQPAPEVDRRMASLDAYVEGVPQPEVLLSLVPAEDAPTIHEYLEIFNGPVNVDLDSESVWPMPTPLEF